MSSSAQKKQAPLQPFQPGQIWQMENSHVRIAEVGKTLVHYKLLTRLMKRGPNRLLSKPALEQFLRARNAVLLR